MFRTLPLMMAAALGATALHAQNNTSSPYTRYGYGEICEPGYGYQHAIGGLQAGVRNNNHITPGNPATFTSIDSMGFRFEFGGSARRSSFTAGGASQASWDVNLEYLAMQFPIGHYMGLSVGLTPYSVVGYDFGDKVVSPSTTLADTVATNHNYTGEGDITQFYLGLAGRILERLHLGMTVQYNWGTIDHNSNVSFDNRNYHPTEQVSSLRVHDWNVGFGAQWVQPLPKERQVTIGATLSLPGTLKSDAKKTVTTTLVDTIKTSYDDDFELPLVFGIGFAYNFNEGLMAGIDYKLKKWSQAKYFGEKDFNDQNRIALGVEWQPNARSKRYCNRVSYRVGFNTVNSYFTVNGQEPRTNAITCGLGLPLKRTANPSVLNLGFEYQRTGKDNGSLILEESFRFSLNMTMNEKWFAKRKFE